MSRNEQVLSELLNVKLLMITGKGGVGKSLFAASVAQYAASQGKRVCLVGSASEDQLAPLFGKAPLEHQITKLYDQIFGINLDSQGNFRDFVVKHLGHEKVFKKIFSNDIVKSLINMLPGVAELTLLGRLYYTAEISDRRFDLVIFDGFSSGHFFNLLTTPEAILRSGLVGPVLKETERLLEFLGDSARCGAVLLTIAEPLVMTEFKEFYRKIKEDSPVHLRGAVVNKSEPNFVGLKRELSGITQSDLVKRFKKKADQSESTFAEMSEFLDNSDHFMKLPDLGWIDEPLAGDFYQRFLV